jgi:hypothetical protein
MGRYKGKRSEHGRGGERGGEGRCYLAIYSTVVYYKLRHAHTYTRTLHTPLRAPRCQRKQTSVLTYPESNGRRARKCIGGARDRNLPRTALVLVGHDPHPSVGSIPLQRIRRSVVIPGGGGGGRKWEEGRKDWEEWGKRTGRRGRRSVQYISTTVCLHSYTPHTSKHHTDTPADTHTDTHTTRLPRTTPPCPAPLSSLFDLQL